MSRAARGSVISLIFSVAGFVWLAVSAFDYRMGGWKVWQRGAAQDAEAGRRRPEYHERLGPHASLVFVRFQALLEQEIRRLVGASAGDVELYVMCAALCFTTRVHGALEPHACGSMCRSVSCCGYSF